MPDYTDAQVDRGLETALAEAASFGTTTIIDPKADDWMLRGYQRFADDGRLTLRVKAAVEIEPGEDPAAAVAEVVERRALYPGPLVEVNAVKVFVDGVIEAETAAMLAPYEGEDFSGNSNFAPEALDALAVAADAAGLQVHAHAIGDRAVREALDAFAAARAANGPRDGRHQIAHAEVIDPADIPRFGELDAIANFQPLWAYPDPYIVELTEPVIGPERSEWLYPIGAVLESGGQVVAGSDWSVSSMNPLEGIEVGVTRQDPDDPEGEVLTPQHRVPVEAMLRAYTADAAFAAFSEAEAGSLTVGKRGDVVVLDRDLTAIDPHAISDARVMLTLFGGAPVFQADDLPAPAGP
jgi:predicted amidohydrolase YtcJ